MELLTFVLYNHDKLDEVLSELENSGIKGATVIDSTGMAKVLHHEEEEVAWLGTIRSMLNGASRSKSNTILMVLKKEQVQNAIDAIERIVGDLNQEKVGIVFCTSLNYVKGISNNE